jgi:hypothetical protein
MTIPQSENPPAAHTTTTTLPQQATPRSDTNLPQERRRAYREAAQQWSELASGQVAAPTCPHEPPQHEPLVE